MRILKFQTIFVSPIKFR